MEKVKYVYMEDNKKHFMLIKSDLKKLKWKKNMFVETKLFDFNNLPSIYEFNIKNKTTREITEEFLTKNQISSFEDNNEVEEFEDIKGNNSEIFQNTVNQKIDQKTIEKLKKTTESEDLIKKIIENNDNFENRTQFSKEKYIKRKINKYINIFTFQEPTVFLINKYFLYAKPNEYYPIGIHSIGSIIQYLDINEKSNILLSEKTKGCLLSLILEELEDDSDNIISLIDTEKEMNKQYYTCIKYLNYEDKFNKHCRKIEEKSDIKYNFFISCSEFDAISIIKSLKERFLVGCKFIIFSNSLIEINKVSQYLFETKEIIDISIIELFGRNMQVLPLRCHPEMMGKTQQGFLLTGYKINN